MKTAAYALLTFLIFRTGVLCDRVIEKRQTVTACSIDTFNCSNGLCIDSSLVCDGLADCSDSSDETQNLCSKLFKKCPGYAFRCKYGACVDKSAKCNGINDCVDGSDENLPECKPTSQASLQSNNGYSCQLDYRDSFNCSNGLCIDSSLVCDGLADCSDSSDETKNVCSNLFKKCPSYAFRCKYGACVDKSAKCNGINDCVDGSDENLPECKPTFQASLHSNTGSKCRRDEYTCKSGQCIDNTTTCDGSQDCSDGSDETSALCKSFQCPKYSFVCNYGACISKEYKCDGKVHCLDGSDETVCAPPKIQQQASTKKPPKPALVTTTSTSTIQPTTQSNKKKTCLIPTEEGSIYRYDNGISVLTPGKGVDQYRIVVENCKPGYYKAYPDRYMICSAAGKWEPLISHKLCLKMCTPLTSDSLNLKCTFNGERVDCSSPSAPGTKLRPLCKITHGLPNGEIETPIELICQPDGNWSRQLYRCVPHCGRTYTPHKVLITNGSKANYGTAPWNVAIYKKDDNDYNMICGGTLISLNLVVSAAHCFVEEGSTDRIILNNNMYKVGVGKYDRNISVVDNEFTQIIDVGLIYLKEDYYGASGFHADDIATIVLATNVKISSVVLPVCMDWNKNYGTTPSGSLGKVVGWGRTENKTLSPTLLEALLPYIDHFTCRNMYNNGFELYVTRDKFCAGSESGQGVHEGDSGAGLTFVHNELHFLSGVVSVKDRNTKNAIAVFTDVNYHIQWIRDIYTNNSSTG